MSFKALLRSVLLVAMATGLFACSNDDGSGNTTVVTTETNAAPVASAITIEATEDGTVEAILPAVDEEGDVLTFTIVSQPDNGSVEIIGNKAIYKPDEDFFGEDSFSFQVSDGTSNSAVKVVTFNVAGVADEPVAKALTVSTSENAEVEVILEASDADGDTLIYSIEDQPVNGSLSTVAGNRVTYTPTNSFNGVDSFTYKANDGSSDSQVVTVTLNVTSVNDAPVAVNVTANTTEDSAVEVELQASDVENNTLIYTLVTQPANGTLSAITDNKVTYTPAANYNGTDSFTYKVNDGTSDSATVAATVSVTAVNDAPIATAVSVNTNEGMAVEVALNATDVDSDTLTYIVVASPNSGTLSAVNGNKVTYNPAANSNGSDSFTYKANDGESDSEAVVVTLNVASTNSAPAATAGSFSTDMDKEVVVSLTAQDADGDPLTYTIVEQPKNGSLGLIDSNKVVFSPNVGFTGPDSFSYKANDGVMDSNIAIIQLSVAPLLRGKVIDSPIVNLPYKVGNYEGVTDSEGYFKYNHDGEDIYFTLGNIKLGSAKTQKVITTINVSKSHSALDQKNVELIQFLQTIDEDGDPSNGIYIDSQAHSYQADGDVDFSEENVSAVNVLTNLGWQSLEIVGQEVAINHFLENLASSDDLQDYCEITTAYVGGIFKQDTEDCLQRKYRDTYFNFIFDQISADASTVAGMIENTDISRESIRQGVNQFLNSKKIYEYSKLIGSSNVTVTGKAALKQELVEIVVEAGFASFAGDDYAAIWKNTLFSLISIPEAVLGDPEALATIADNSVDTIFAAAVDIGHAWSLNQLTEKANELQITDYVLVHYFDYLTDQEKIMESLGLTRDFNWSDVVEAVALENGYTKGLLSEDYETDAIIQMVHSYIKLSEKIVGESFTYTNTVSEGEALDAGGLYQTFLSNISNAIETGAIRSPVAESELEQYAQQYYSEAYLSERIYSESPATEGGSRDQWTLWDYHCDDNGLIAGLYKREGKDEYTLSFGGTTATCLKTEWDDSFILSYVDTYFGASLVNNVKEAVIDVAADLFLFSNFPIKPNQGRSALEYLETEPLKSLLGQGKVKTITGHSLGGGLASYTGLYTGVDTVSFNPSPIPFTAESLSLFIDKNLLSDVEFSENGFVSEFKFVNESAIVNLMAAKDPVSLIALELVALQEYANVNPVLNKWYLNPVKSMMFIPEDTQLDYLIQGKQVFLDVDYGSIGAQHSMVNLLNTFTLYNKDFDEDGFLDVLDDFPSDPLYYLDSDGDGLPNEWEETHNLDPSNTDNSLEDGDIDDLSNLAEFINKTDPEKPDSDGDGMPDGWEVSNSLDPLSDDSSGDPDGDLIVNIQEFLDGTNALDPEDFFIPEASGELRLVSQITNPAAIQLSWSPVDQAESYVMCYSTETMDNMPADGLTNCVDYLDARWLSDISGTAVTVTEGLAFGETYYFRMAAVRSGKVGLISNQLEVVLDSDSEVALDNGLVAHYAFEENGNDSSVNQFNASETNVSYVDGVVGKAAYLPNGNSMLLAPHSWPELQSFTVSMFVKLDHYALDAVENTPSRNVFMSFDHATPGLENALELALEAEYSNEPEKRNLSVRITADRELYSNLTPNEFLKEWTSIIYTREGGFLKVYVDGQLFQNYDSPSTVSFTPSNLAIGKDHFLLSDSLALFGAIDELKIYNRSVTSIEIEALSAKGDDSSSGNGKLNDTGVVKCVDRVDVDLDCPVSGHSYQDAEYGRDVETNSNSDGHAGFSFTKISSTGSSLSSSVSDWSCVKDNVTGLIWEAKQGGNDIKGDEGLHDADDIYTWYSSSAGLSLGFENSGSASCFGYTSGSVGSFCNTKSYVDRVNGTQLCGFSDWRLPSLEEIGSLVSYDRQGYAIDEDYFPNTSGDQYSLGYFTSTLYVAEPDTSWVNMFWFGYFRGLPHSDAQHLRLVKDSN